MSIFSKTSASVLGVDIGAGSIKVVELRNEKRRARLSTYGFAETNFPVTDPASNLSSDLGTTASVLRAVCREAKTEAKRAVTSLPVAAVFSSIISLPRMPKSELPPAVEWEAKKLLPLPIEEMIIDWKLLTPESELAKKDDGATTVRILLTAAPKALVQQYLTVFSDAGLQLVSLETEAFALLRSLVGDDPSTVLILDIGAARTSMIIADHGTPVLSRSVDLGGLHLTRAIADAVGVDATAAESMKLDLASMSTGNSTAEAIPALVEKTFAPVVQEIRYGVNLFLSQEEHQGRVVDKVILAGGSALLPTLTEHLANVLRLRVFVGDPWARVLYPADLRPALDGIGARFAVAVGLAMREIS